MSEARGPVRPRDLFRSPLVLFFLLGLLVRLAGTLFNGVTDLYQILLDWGFVVRREGLVAAFHINYGILSYAAFGLAAAAADVMPRFWWAPYKLIILAFDVATLLVLLRVVPPERRTLALILYWLNPWFIIHEAYHGFWEGPHMLFGLLAVLALKRAQAGGAWFMVGVLLMVSAMFKPQGLIHFIGPLGVYLAVQWLRGNRAPFAFWLAGLATVAGATSLLIAAAGGSAFALVDNYRSAFATMSGVSNGGPGIWRFVSFVYMSATAQTGHVAFVHMPRLLTGILSGVAALACLGVFLVFSVRTTIGSGGVSIVERLASRVMRPDAPVTRPPAETVLLMLALGSLVMSQFGARAHINHSFTAMVLLVPLAAASTDIRRLWTALSALLGLSHLLIFALGNAALLPPDSVLPRYSAAASFVQRVTALPAYRSPDALLVIQQWLANLVSRLPGETLVSLLSPVVFLVACLLVRAIFQVAAQPKLAIA